MELGIQAPDVDLIHHGLIVRPDVLLVALVARVEDVSPTQAVSILREAAATLQARALVIHAGAHLSARRLDLGRNTVDKSSKVSLANAQIEGVLHVPLDDSLDYWARAGVLAKTTEVLRSLAVEFYKSKLCVRFGFRAPTPRVQDVTAHKIELTTRYAAQWRALTGNAEKPPGNGSWEIPDEVAQYAVSLEEVRLMLVPARKFPSSREA